MTNVIKLVQPLCAFCKRKFKPAKISNEGYCCPACALNGQRDKVQQVLKGDAKR